MKWKQFAAFCMTGILLTTFTGCGAKEGGDEPASSVTEEDGTEQMDVTDGSSLESGDAGQVYDFGGVTVRAQNFGDLTDTSNLKIQAAKEAVEKKYNIKLVNVDESGFDGTNFGEKLIASIAADDPIADLVNFNTGDCIPIFTNQLLYDITDYLDELQIGSVYTDAASWQGRCYGVSYNNLGPNWHMTYDRKLLRDIGMEEMPTDLFMDGRWDYANFKAYLTEMKSRLPEGVYPIGFYPFHWALMASSANGVPLIGPDGEINLTDEAVIEATVFYQELLNEGLAYPSGPITLEDGTPSYDYAYTTDDDRIVLKVIEDWQYGSVDFEFGVVFFPWGSNVTCPGDYTTLSENYKVASRLWAFDAVVATAPERTGIPGEVLTEITKDFRFMTENGAQIRMTERWTAEQNGMPVDFTTYAGMGSFRAEEDLELIHWGYSRFYADFSWGYDLAGLVQTWKPFEDIFWDRLDVRSTLESYYNEGAARLQDAGIMQ